MKPPVITMIEACYGPVETEQLKFGHAPKACCQCGKDAGIHYWNLWRFRYENELKPLCRLCEDYVEKARDLIYKEVPEAKWWNIEILPNRSQVKKIKELTEKRNG